MKVRELMSPDVITVRPQTFLGEAARLMAARGISGLPVEEDGRLVGMLTEADFLDRAATRGGTGLVDLFPDRQERGDRATTVGDVMTTSIISIGPDESHVEAVRLMRHRHVKRLPVVDDDGHIVGVVSRADILAVFTRPDDVIEHDIRHRIVGQVLAIEPGQLSVEVREGNVHLAGFVQAKTEAALLQELIGAVDGVWSVDSSLRFLVDDTRRHDEPTPFGVCQPTGRKETP